MKKKSAVEFHEFSGYQCVYAYAERHRPKGYGRTKRAALLQSRRIERLVMEARGEGYNKGRSISEAEDARRVQTIARLEGELRNFERLDRLHVDNFRAFAHAARDSGRIDDQVFKKMMEFAAAVKLCSKR